MKTILVIDDDEPIAELLREILVDAGYLVLVARDGRDGLEMAKRLHPDLVLCDIMLPYLDGYEVALGILQDPALKPTPVVLMSAGLIPLPRRDQPWRAFIRKPFNIAQIASMVAEQLPAA